MPETLREKIASIVMDMDMKHGSDSFIDADATADRILAIPEVQEGLALKRKFDAQRASVEAERDSGARTVSLNDGALSNDSPNAFATNAFGKQNF